MSVNFKRGFFRAWLVLSLGWIAVTGRSEYYAKPWNFDWPGVQVQGECWDTIARWPDGQHFDPWDGQSPEHRGQPERTRLVRRLDPGPEPVAADDPREA